jgi:signal transduction histidine kinase
MPEQHPLFSPNTALGSSPLAKPGSGLEFDQLLRWMQGRFQVPMAGVSYLTSDREVIKTTLGFSLREIPLERSLGFQLLALTEFTFQADCASVPELSRHPLVSGEPFFRFYAAIPIGFSEDGHCNAFLFLADPKPREWTREEIHEFREFGRMGQVVMELQALRQQQNLGISTNGEQEKKEGGVGLSTELVLEQNARLLNFSYIVSHNLRAHTSNIRAILSYLDEIEDPSEKEEMIEHLKKISDLLDDSILQLNQLASIQRNVNIEIKPLSLHQVLEHNAALVAKSLQREEGILENQIPPETEVRFNPAYLDSLFQNFLTNAINYRHPDRRPEIKVWVQQVPGYTILTFADNGLGIDLKRHGKKIFSMYGTLGPGKKGKGLGLFMVKNQVEALRGKIEVESIPGTGTQFHVYFHANL